MPIHLQLATPTRLATATGPLRSGVQLLTVPELACHLRISPNTVAHVHRVIQAEDLFFSRHDSRPFIAKGAQRVANARSLGPECEKLGTLAEELIAKAQDAGAAGRGATDLRSRWAARGYSPRLSQTRRPVPLSPKCAVPGPTGRSSGLSHFDDRPSLNARSVSL